jgi:PIN domain
MPYDAIAIDTQTVERNGFHFEGGLLEQLKQFKTGPVQLVISEIAVREIFKHLVEKTRLARDALSSAQRKAIEYGIIQEETDSLEAGQIDIDAIVKARLDKFLKDIRAIVLRVDDVSLKELVRRYFGAIPPFSAAGKKKNEFPDAIALLSLEHWATANDKNLLAISGDRDWESFATNSERIDSISDLSEGLALLQQHVEQAEAAIQKILVEISTGQNAELSQNLETFLADEVSGYSIDAEADSFMEVEAEQVDLSLLGYEFVEDDDQFEFIVVQNRDDLIVARINVQLQVRAEASFGFSVYDSIDKDYVGMGSTSTSVEDTFEAAILVTFEREAAEMNFDISKVEIVHAPRSIDFGYVEPFNEPEYEQDYEPPEPDHDPPEPDYEPPESDDREPPEPDYDPPEPPNDDPSDQGPPEPRF